MNLICPKFLDGGITFQEGSHRDGSIAYTLVGIEQSYLFVFKTGDFILTHLDFPFKCKFPARRAFCNPKGVPFKVALSPLKKRKFGWFTSIKKCSSVIHLSLLDNRPFYEDRLEKLRPHFRTAAFFHRSVPATTNNLLRIRAFADYFGYNAILKKDKIYITRHRKKTAYLQRTIMPTDLIEHLIYSNINSVDGFEI